MGVGGDEVKSTVTVNDIMYLDPCEDYTKERVTELWDGREALSLEEIRELDIPIEDRGWAILSILSSRHPNRAKKISRRIALDVAHLRDCSDIVWWYLVTGDETSRAAAWDASAAWDAARDAMSASRSSAWSSAWAAAWAAARAAAWDASDAAWAAAWEKYISWALEVMK
jgi:hypothetical protein